MSKQLTFAMINARVEKKNSWDKLVRLVDPLEEKAPEVGLQNSFNCLIGNKTSKTNKKNRGHIDLRYNYNMYRSNVPQYPDSRLAHVCQMSTITVRNRFLGRHGASLQETSRDNSLGRPFFRQIDSRYESSI